MRQRMGLSGLDDRGWKYLNIAVLAVANLLYFFLAVHRNFCYDEAYTVGMINLSFEDIFEVTSRDVHSPFYYIVLKCFYLFPGMGQLISAKIFSWLFMFLYLLGGGIACHRIFGRKVEFYWRLLSSFMPAMVIQATNARMYTIGLFFVSAASWLAYRLYLEEEGLNAARVQQTECNARRRVFRGRGSKWILFTVTSLIAVYVHTFCLIEMVVVYAIFILVSFFKKRYRAVGRIFASGVVVSIGFLPWLFVLFHQFGRWAGWESGWHNTIEKVDLSSMVTYLAEWFSSLENPRPLAVLFGVALFIYVSYYVRAYVRKSKDYLPYLGLLTAGLVFSAAMLVSVFIVPCFLGRYLFPLFGGIWLFAAVGISEIKKGWIEAVLVAGILLSGFFAFREEVRLEDPAGLEVYEACMEEQLDEDDIIMADTYFLMMLSIYYPDADYMVYGSAPDVLPFKHSVFTSWEQLEDTETVWYLSFADFRVGGLDERYSCEESFYFPFSYYNIQVDKYVRREN